MCDSHGKHTGKPVVMGLVWFGLVLTVGLCFSALSLSLSGMGFRNLKKIMEKKLLKEFQSVNLKVPCSHLQVS